jgi:hypothetical protein
MNESLERAERERERERDYATYDMRSTIKFNNRTINTN